MTVSWEHADVFPVIARIIESECEQDSEFVSHDRIAASLLSDAEGAAIIGAAHQQMKRMRTQEWIAHNMVAWFSQRITVGQSDWKDRFDRIAVDGKWAYKPRPKQS